ncbi:MAG TPA: tRNA (N6-isopentenyl adenosine(37)-C2)-methylthiotransferase MiaB [bacterium]|mgnify:CR=1 FL=1|nr:tRNA (N6-isopentenyl adenosine(37)-C2)-methylthiotransferase MiaB [bacterium]HPJ71087.1 tRNA (N6-isopentenyl adenosine(37)-C2)-methylthiotransferase MiaB [bacterium]HPQ65103.1 tRNA (N6-isopentenyl adenosine(37)-C2)-methylthiotransferase MiaB [bacterium]
MAERYSFFLRTYGCQMNRHDSARIAGALERAGFVRVEDDRDARIVLLNTCSVRDHAEERVRGKLHEYAHRKAADPALVVGVLGCMAEIRGSELAGRFPAVDLVVGPGRFSEIGALLRRVLGERDRIVAPGTGRDEAFFSLEPSRSPGPRASITIMRGCDNFCSYCIVPFSRGREWSRPPRDILAEARRAAAAGCREITLLGQNVNSYRGRSGDGSTADFPDLLLLLDGVEGVKRIRFVTSHPKDISESLIQAVRELKSVCEDIHFPAQSGSDRILSLMNRGYSREEYLEKAARLRRQIPGVSLRSDFIVGFPSETETDYLRTLDLMERARFSQVFAFTYSPRPGTAAARLDDDVGPEEKSRRLDALLRLQQRIGAEENELFVGETVEVMHEGRNRLRPERGQGRARDGRMVFYPLTRAHPPGSLLRIAIAASTPLSLFGETVTERPAHD